MGGKPRIRDLRITVYDVLDYLASGMTREQILADFPDLNSDDLLACLAFAADRERRLTSIPASLVGELDELYPQSAHVRDVELKSASDRAVWEYAGTLNRLLNRPA